MNLPRFSFRSRYSSRVRLLCLAWVASCLPLARAATPVQDFGMRILQAQLPAGASLRRLDCEHLAATVHAATLAHRRDTVAIFSAALTLDDWNARGKVEERLSCACVTRIFHASVTAAPGYAVILLEIAEAIYPDCAEGLTAALRGLDSSKEVAVVSRDTGTGANANQGNDPGTGTAGTGDPSSAGDGVYSLNGNGDPGGLTSYGAGVGPGFPGAPGFSGSSPSGGYNLPSPVSVAVTVAVNN